MTRTGEDLGKPLLIEVLEEHRRAIGTSLVVMARLRLTNQTGQTIRVESFALRSLTPPAEADEEAVRREVEGIRADLRPALASSWSTAAW